MDRQQKDFLEGATKFAENEKGDPSAVSFPPGEHAALSYGRMQNDIGGNPGARQTFYRALSRTQGDTGLDQSEIIKAMILGSNPEIKEETFEKLMPGTLAKIRQGLALSPDAVAAQDDASAGEMLGKVDMVLAAARNRKDHGGELAGDDPNMRLLAKIGAWGNRNPHLNETAAFIRDTPQVTEAAFDEFMRKQRQFNHDINPKAENYDTWAGRIARATEVGRKAAGVPANGFNSDPSDVTAPGWAEKPSMFNSEGYRANMFNALEDELHRAGY